MNLILQMGGGNVTDLPSADVISATVQAILGDPPANGEKPNIGLEIIKSSTNVLQVWKKFPYVTMLRKFDLLFYDIIQYIITMLRKFNLSLYNIVQELLH
jgi:hypothetical protein